MRRRSDRRGARSRGITLAELIIGMMITSLVALSVASMLHAVSYGTSTRRDVRRVVARSERLRSRCDDAIRTARAVLATGDGYIVLWRGDTNASDAAGSKNVINLSELRLIELPSASTTLSSHTTVFPANWTQVQIDAADTVYAAGSNFAAVAQAAKGGSYAVAAAWSEEVAGFTVALDEPTPANAHRVTWSLTLSDELLDENLVSVVSLRSQAAPE